MKIKKTKLCYKIVMPDDEKLKDFEAVVHAENFLEAMNIFSKMGALTEYPMGALKEHITCEDKDEKKSELPTNVEVPVKEEIKKEVEQTFVDAIIDYFTKFIEKLSGEIDMAWVEDRNLYVIIIKEGMNGGYSYDFNLTYSDDFFDGAKWAVKRYSDKVSVVKYQLNAKKTDWEKTKDIFLTKLQSELQIEAIKLYLPQVQK